VLVLIVLDDGGNACLGDRVLAFEPYADSRDLGGFSNGDPNIARAIGVTAVWLTALVGMTFTRFARSDID